MLRHIFISWVWCMMMCSYRYVLVACNLFLTRCKDLRDVKFHCSTSPATWLRCYRESSACKSLFRPGYGGGRSRRPVSVPQCRFPPAWCLGSAYGASRDRSERNPLAEERRPAVRTAGSERHIAPLFRRRAVSLAGKWHAPLAAGDTP